MAEFYSWQDASRTEWGHKDYTLGDNLPFDLHKVSIGSLQRIAKSLENSEIELKKIASSFEKFVFLMDPEAQIRKKEIEEEEAVWEAKWKEIKAEEAAEIAQTKLEFEPLVKAVLEMVPQKLSVYLKEKVEFGIKELGSGCTFKYREEVKKSLENFNIEDRDRLLGLYGIGKYTANKILSELQVKAEGTAVA